MTPAVPADLDLVIVSESEAAARRRLIAHGYDAAIAEEIAVYLAQATDLAALEGELAASLKAEGVAARFVALDDILHGPGVAAADPARTVLWCLTDGIRFYRGSSVASVARLAGLPRYGAPPTAQHIAQDKFASLAMAAAAGLAIPPTWLVEDRQVLARLGHLGEGPLFVKPATLGAKIGIFADSLCADQATALDRCARLWDRYGDRALVQPFVSGDDVRVSFMETGRGFAEQLGLYRLAKDPASETGGAFMTMKDNETLSGARDTSGTRGGFGEGHAAAFVPRMIDLRRSEAATDRAAVPRLEAAAAAFARLLQLTDYFSMDFRIGPDGQPVFFEFETGPAVTIYDFAAYLEGTHGLTLGQALARSVRLALSRHGTRPEA